MIIIEHENYIEIGFEDFNVNDEEEIKFSIAPLGDNRILIFNDRQITVPYQLVKTLYRKPFIKLFSYYKLNNGMIVGFPVADVEVDRNAVWKVL